MARLIRASAGDTEYVSAVVTETNGVNISGDVFKVSLGSYDSPNGWRVPDAVEMLSLSQIRVKLLVGAQGTVVPTPGTYWLWIQVGDAPETETVRVSTDRIIVA